MSANCFLENHSEIPLNRKLSSNKGLLVCIDRKYDSKVCNAKVDNLNVALEMKEYLPNINIIPASPQDYVFPSKSKKEDIKFLMVPPKPTKGDYYAKEYWEKCTRIDSENLVIQKQICTSRRENTHSLHEQDSKAYYIKRIHYIRGANNSFTKLYSKFYYVYNRKFNENLPFNTEFIRYSLDHKGKINSYSKCGLCPFCPKVVFKNIMNFEYQEHLLLFHGVTQNNRFVPNPECIGLHTSLNENLHHNEVYCPVCLVVFKHDNYTPLTNYMKHFKDTNP